MIGQTISHYRIIEKLGEGGMGVVYKAQDLTLDRFVALKFLPLHLTVNEAEQARFLQEAKAASAINHPHVCIIHAVEEQDGQKFLVMEYVDGVTLRRKFEDSPLKINDALTYATQVLEALQEAHGKGIVHRDIKSDNIMVNSKNQIKVMDFGLAKLKGSLKLTRTSSTVGTLAYMAPEQIQGGEVDARSDIFSLGVVLFEMLTARTPFRGEHEAAIVYSIVNEPPESLLKLRSDASPELERIINRALEKDPEDRYQSAVDMLSEIRRVLKQSSRVSRASLADVRIAESAEVAQKSTEALTPRKKARFTLIVGAIAVLALAIVSYFVFFTPNKSIDSLAVLPFVNAAGDPNADYLSDGITESLINSLSQLSNLTVMSRSSVFRYKGKEIDPSTAGKELGVKAVLTGRMTLRGENLLVSTELVDVSRNSHIWGEQYNRKLSDLIALQEELSKEISGKLSLKLAGEDARKLTKRSTENTEAYQLYLKGRFYWNKRTADDIKRSIDYINQAIEKDPSYAQAYAGLASAYALLPEYADSPIDETVPKVEAAAKKALEIDGTLAEPYAALGVTRQDEWRWEDAEREYKRAIELNPNYATTHHWYSLLLAYQNRLEEALSEIRQAQGLDPLSLIINQTHGEVLGYLRKYDKAIEQLKKTTELDQNFWVPHTWLGVIFERQGRFDEAIPEFQTARMLTGGGPANLGRVYALAGRKSDALRVLDTLLQRGASATSIALIYDGLGDKEKALEWLERGYQGHIQGMRGLKVNPRWDNLRSEPRFKALLKKIGLEK